MEEGSLFQRMKQIFHEDEMDEEMQKEAAALIRNIFRYMDKDAKDIMTHRKKPRQARPPISPCGCCQPFMRNATVNSSKPFPNWTSTPA